MSIDQKRKTNQKLYILIAALLTVSLGFFLTSCKQNNEIYAYLASPLASPPERAMPSPASLQEQPADAPTPSPSQTPDLLIAASDVLATKELAPSPTAEATPQPTMKPAPKPSPATTPKPTVKPAPKPTLKKTAAPTAKPTPKPTTTPATGGLQAKENQMIALVNGEREAAGLPALTYDSSLRAPARKHSNDMSANNFFSHTSPTYGTFSKRLADSGVRYSSAGENLAMYGSVASAHEGLMNSSGHKANILNTNYSRIGIGIVYNESRGMYYITQWFAG